MKNSILKQIFVIGAGTIINVLIGIITVPIITRIVSPEIYGQFTIFDTYASVAVLILCLGFDQALVRFYYVEDSSNYKSTLFYNCVKYPIILSTILLIVLSSLSFLDLIDIGFNNSITFLLFIYIFLQLLLRFSTLVIRLEQNSKLFSFVNVSQRVNYLVILFLIFRFLNVDKLLALVLSISLACLISLVFGLIFQKNIWNHLEIQKDGFPISMKELFTYSWPFIISIGIAALFNVADELSLNYLTTYTDVGIYSSAMTLANMFAIIQTTFNTVWTPISVEHYEQDKTDRKFFTDTYEYVTITMFFFGLSMILVKDLFAYFLGSAYREAVFVLPFLLYRPILYTITETTTNGLVFEKKSKLLSLINAVSLLFNIVGNFILIPKFGFKGAAFATGLSYVFLFYLKSIISNKYFYIDLKLPKITLLIIATTIFSLYNSYYSFNVISFLMYLSCLIMIVVLYRKTIKSGFIYLKRYLKKFIS